MNSARVKLQHRPFLTPIWLTACAVVLAFLFALFAVWIWGTADSTTVMVVREAEAASVEADSPLSVSGEARAQALAQKFANAASTGGLTSIYTANTRRSILTAEPLARRLQLTPATLPAQDVKGFVHRALHDFAGGRALIVASPDTLPKIVTALADSSQVIATDDMDYDTLYIVSVPRIGHTNVLKLRY